MLKGDIVLQLFISFFCCQCVIAIAAVFLFSFFRIDLVCFLYSLAAIFGLLPLLPVFANCTFMTLEVEPWHNAKVAPSWPGYEFETWKIVSSHAGCIYLNLSRPCNSGRLVGCPSVHESHVIFILGVLAKMNLNMDIKMMDVECS